MPAIAWNAARDRLDCCPRSAWNGARHQRGIVPVIAWNTHDNTVNSALRTLGYDTREQITGHGFRATARTLIRELLGWDRDVIERHMAHVSDEELGDSYDRATFLDQRRQMIQLWANLLDELAAGKALAPPAHMRQAARAERSRGVWEGVGEQAVRRAA